MKKIYFLIIICSLFLFPFIVYAESCESNKIVINSIELINKSGSAKRIESNIEDNTININAELKNIGDSIDYKIVLNNVSNEIYYIENKNNKSDNDYLEYTIIDENENSIQPLSSKEISLHIEYKNEIPEDLLENSRYTENNTIFMDAIDASSLQNPNTSSSVLYIIVIIIAFFIIILLLSTKKTINILIIVFIVLIPVIVSATCNTDIKINTSIIISKNNPICIRATNLHTDTCQRTYNACYSAGYNLGETNNSRNTKTIKYGNLGNIGEEPQTGDAFTCDVNNDGVYDEETERFYYLYDSDDKSIMIFYSSVYLGNRSNRSVAYDANGTNAYGPRTAGGHMPTEEQWSNPKIIKPGIRQITNENGETTVIYQNTTYSLPTFNYSNRVARLLTTQELMSVFHLNSLEYIPGSLNDYAFLFEGFEIFKKESNTYSGFWLETPYSSNNYQSWNVSAYNLTISYGNAYAYIGIGARPVITILSSDLDN